MIRAARADDAAAIVAIWNPLVEGSTITFTTAQKTEEGLRAMIAERGENFLVAELDDEILGFASFGSFRSGSGYAASAEHSIILSPAAQRRGVGMALIRALEDRARTSGKHVLVAGISGENEAAIAFHRAAGFDETARMSEVGRKFGRWLDLVLMQKIL